MKASQGGTAKNDKIAAPKIAVLLRGGRLPQASVYPAERRRATRDLLRRRCPLVRQRAKLFAHMQKTHSHYNLPEMGKKLADKATRAGGEDPLSGVGFCGRHSRGEPERVWQDRSIAAYWDIVTHSSKPEGGDVLPQSSVSMDRRGH